MRTDMRTDMTRDRRAFTLIEILMAMMVLSIGLASVLSVFIVGLRSSRRVVDESTAAVAAKAVLSRVLYEDVAPAGGDGVRDYLELIAIARGIDPEPDCDWVWIHDKTDAQKGTIGGDEGDTVVADPVRIALKSRFSWRCRASRFRGEPGKPRLDLVVNGAPVPLKQGRIPASQEHNPDSEEMWRLLIEIYRDYEKDRKALASFETYVCLAHR